MPSPACAALVLLSLAGAHLLAGCGATGLAWVGEARSDPPELAQSVATSTRISAAPESDLEADAHPRLRRTVTLGMLDVADSGSAATASPEPYVTSGDTRALAVAPRYANFGYARGDAGRSPRRAGSGVPAPQSSSSGPRPGQNWPEIANHGPTFPYLSTPASPWADGH